MEKYWKYYLFLNYYLNVERNVENIFTLLCKSREIYRNMWDFNILIVKALKYDENLTDYLIFM